MGRKVGQGLIMSGTYVIKIDDYNNNILYKEHKKIENKVNKIQDFS